MSDAFEVFNLPIKYDIKKELLEKEYFARQQEFHPDKFSNKSEEEKLFSAQQAAKINDIYEKLKDDRKRAELLLKMQGIIVNAENENIKPSEHLLISVLEKREEMHQETELNQLNDLLKFAKQEYKECVEDLNELFNNSDYKHAAEATIRLRYIEKYIEEVKLKIKSKKKDK